MASTLAHGSCRRVDRATDVFTPPEDPQPPCCSPFGMTLTSSSEGEKAVLATLDTHQKQGLRQHAEIATPLRLTGTAAQEGTLTMGMEFSSCSEGDSGVLAIMRCL